MGYFVLVGGGVALVFIWLNVAKKKGDRDATQRMLASLVGTGAVLWGMWAWGVQSIQEDNQTAYSEQLWLETFADAHHRAWDADCQGILTSKGANGVLYDPQTGDAYTIAYCQSMWSPPVQPTQYSSSTYDQPESTPPFASEAVFGPSVSGVRCVDPGMVDCHTWDDYVTAPMGGG